MKYFEIRNVIKKYPDMTMYIIFGERSNGKTYSCLDYALEEYATHGYQAAYLRRSREDIKSKITGALYANHIRNGRFEHFFKNEKFVYNSVRIKGDALYPQHVWYTDSGVRKSHTAEKPILIVSALSTWVHGKGISFPDVRTVIFDEFLTNEYYLPDEVNIFQQLLSSYVRERGNVKVFLIGNTVSRYSPYFSELGLANVSDMKPGDSQVYTSGDGKAKYLVMLTDKSGGKDSDKYFSVFNNKASAMITGGEWEMSAYPIIRKELNDIPTAETFFICFNKQLIRGDVKVSDQIYVLFTPSRMNMMYDEYFHRTDWYTDKICYTDFLSLNVLDRFNMVNQGDPLARIVRKAMSQGRAYYSTNALGDTVDHYMKWCGSM